MGFFSLIKDKWGRKKFEADAAGKALMTFKPVPGVRYLLKTSLVYSGVNDFALYTCLPPSIQPIPTRRTSL